MPFFSIVVWKFKRATLNRTSRKSFTQRPQIKYFTLFLLIHEELVVKNDFDGLMRDYSAITIFWCMSGFKISLI